MMTPVTQSAPSSFPWRPSPLGYELHSKECFFLFVMTPLHSLVLLSHEIHLDEDHVTVLELFLCMLHLLFFLNTINVIVLFHPIIKNFF